MRKTFITTMPDHAGAFVRAGRIMTELGLNITRVSYNKAIDIHTLFLEAEGDAAALERAADRLQAIGYLQGEEAPGTVVLVEFRLPDRPGAISGVADLISRYSFNISYMSSQPGTGGCQDFQMGLFVEEPERFARFLEEAAGMYPVRVIDYDKTEKLLDNTVFYISFAGELAARMGLGAESRGELAVNANLVMQLLEQRGESFHKTFDYIRGFSEALARCRGENFRPRITEHQLGPDVRITLIEPPCGSNTCILRHGGAYLFVDTGYACYRQEMLGLLRELIPDFDTCRRSALLTHADADHCGLLDLFDTTYMSRRTRASLLAEQGEGGYRELNPLHAPYIRICKILTGHRIPPEETMHVIGRDIPPPDRPLADVGSWQFGELTFELYEGQGGHLPGELVLVERRYGLVFTGDILVNLKELTPEQMEHNRYAPYLMTSVDTGPTLCAQERRALPDLLGSGHWNIFSGHGAKKELIIP